MEDCTIKCDNLPMYPPLSPPAIQVQANRMDLSSLVYLRLRTRLEGSQSVLNVNSCIDPVKLGRPLFGAWVRVHGQGISSHLEPARSVLMKT